MVFQQVGSQEGEVLPEGASSRLLLLLPSRLSLPILRLESKRKEIKQEPEFQMIQLDDLAIFKLQRK